MPKKDLLTSMDEKFKFDPRWVTRVRERPRYSLSFDPKENMTQQHHKDECDINTIMKKYRVSGTAPQHGASPIYGDFSNLPSYQESLNIVKAGQEAFMQLSAELRKRFDNDPQKFLDFAADPANADEMVSLGLRKAPSEPPAPVEVRVVNQEPQATN